MKLFRRVETLALAIFQTLLLMLVFNWIVDLVQSAPFTKFTQIASGMNLVWGMAKLVSECKGSVGISLVVTSYSITQWIFLTQFLLYWSGSAIRFYILLLKWSLWRPLALQKFHILINLFNRNLAKYKTLNLQLTVFGRRLSQFECFWRKTIFMSILNVCLTYYVDKLKSIS